MDLYKQFPDSPLNFDEKFEELLAVFKKYEITIFDLLSTSSLEISNRIQRSNNEVNSFIGILKDHASQQTEPISADKLSLNQSFTTGDDKFDELLGGGGIKTGMITEIFGESSTGKSQFCMQLTRTVQYSVEKGGLNGNAVYISTEGRLPTERLIKINPQIEKVFYINCADLETQEHILNVQLPIILQNPDKNIKLVIIDSISHHLRVELLADNFESFKQNQKYIDRIGLYLNSLAVDHNIAIVVTNQISDRPNSNILNTDFKKITYDYQLGWLSGWNDKDIRLKQDNEESNDNKIATLGLNWTNNISVRILLKKTYKPGYNNYIDQQREQIQSTLEHEELNSNGWIMNRSMKLVFSPFISNDKNESAQFKIVFEGLVSIT